MTTNLTLPRLDLEEDTGAGNEMWFESRQAPKDLLQLYKRDPTKLSLNERWFCNDNYMAYTSELARLATEKIKDTSYAGKMVIDWDYKAEEYQISFSDGTLKFRGLGV